MSRNRKSAKQAGARMEQAVADYLAWALTDRRVEVDGEGGVAEDIVEDLLDSGVLIPPDLTWHDLASRFPQLREEGK